MKRITYSGVKVFRFMTEFQFLEVLNLAILWLATPWKHVKNWKWHSWSAPFQVILLEYLVKIDLVKIVKCIKQRPFCLEFIKKKHDSYLSVCQILVERAYYNCFEENPNLWESLWLKLFQSFEVIQIKLATHGPYVE